MDRRALTHDDQRGFALIEVIVAAALLLVGLSGTLSLIDRAGTTTAKTRNREAGTALQRELVEATRSVPYDQITPNGLANLVSLRPGLSDGTRGSAGWTINRRDETYSVSVGVCTVDDPRDGTGAHDGGVFCRTSAATSTAACASLLGASSGTTGATGAGAVTPGDCGIDSDLDGTADGLVQDLATSCAGGACSTPVDPAPADYKRVVSLVRWDGGGWNLQTTTINSPGAAAAPAALTLTAPTTTVTSGTGLVLTSTVSPTPAAVSFVLEGRQIATGTAGSGDSWTGTWNLGTVSAADGVQPVAGEVLDGSALLSAKGFDQYGEFGASRSLTVLVNRRRPFAPVRVEAGRNGAAVEIEWSPGKENDLEGHRVYRWVGLGAHTEVCALAQRTSCRDTSPPGGPSVKYEVVAVDRDAAGALREGDKSVAANVTLTNQPPPPPQTLSLAPSSSGPVLTWTAPAGPDPDLGDSIDHYNIYRDGTGPEDRIDRTDVASLTWTDVTATNVQHQYWIKAVDTQLAESVAVGPVTG